MPDPTCGDALTQLAEPVRNRYFYGKLLDEQNLALEQRYQNRKRWLLNRLALGAGVLCGLEVVVANDGRRIVVRPGVAIDGLGREIIVPGDSPAIDPRRLVDEHGRAADAPIAGAATVTVCLAYHECPGDPVRAFVADCDAADGCVPGSVRERYAIVVRDGAPSPIARPQRLTGLFDGSLDAVLPTLGAPDVCPAPDPASASVVLARVDLPAVATNPPSIDIVNVRPLVYTNARLFEMILSLAERFDAYVQAHP